MGWEDFRFNIEGFEDEIFMAEGNLSNACPHVSAYNAELGVELAFIDGSRLLFSEAKRGRNRNGYILAPSHCTINSKYFDVYDPLMVRCVAIEWLEEYKATHGGNK